LDIKTVQRHAEHPQAVIALYIVYCILASILLLNVLIAMLSRTVTHIEDSRDSTYWCQRAFFCLQVEKSLPLWVRRRLPQVGEYGFLVLVERVDGYDSNTPLPPSPEHVAKEEEDRQRLLAGSQATSMASGKNFVNSLLRNFTRQRTEPVEEESLRSSHVSYLEGAAPERQKGLKSARSGTFAPEKGRVSERRPPQVQGVPQYYMSAAARAPPGDDPVSPAADASDDDWPEWHERNSEQDESDSETPVEVDPSEFPAITVTHIH